MHALKLTFAMTEGQRSCGFVPVEGDGAVGTLFVVVTVVFIFIKGELTISARVNTDFQRFPILFSGVLYIRTPRYDTPCFNVERNKVDGGGFCHRLPTF